VGIPAAAAAAVTATTPAAAGRPPHRRPPAGRCLRSLTCSTTCHRAEASRWEQRCRLQLPAAGSRLLWSGCNIAAGQQTAIGCSAIESRRVRDGRSVAGFIWLYMWPCAVPLLRCPRPQIEGSRPPTEACI
jgi:hypothetical protein